MSTLSRFGALLAFASLIALSQLGSFAEISVDRSATKTSFILLGRAGAGAATPWPTLQYRLNIDSSLVLNPDGDANGDRGSTFAIDPQSGRPHVVWSWFDGQDLEIAISYWDGEAWSAKEVITDNDVDDLDPSIAFASDGTREVSWWREGGAGEVWYRGEALGTGWASEEQVSSQVESGSRPTVVDFQSVTRVSYQIESGSITEIRVTRRDGTGSWQSALIATTGYQGPTANGDIDVVLHERDGKLWVDWLDADGIIAYSVYDEVGDTWSVPESRSYSAYPGEREYDARERARVNIRQMVFE